MFQADVNRALCLVALAALGQLFAITGIFYVVVKNLWLWMPLPGGAYLGLRYLEEHAKNNARKACE